MRVNCHAHIFNLDSALSKRSLSIIERRIVEAVVEKDFANEAVSSQLGKHIGRILVQRLADRPSIDERQFLRDFLEDLDRKTDLVRELDAGTSKLPGALGDFAGQKIRQLPLLGLRSVVSRLTGLLRRKGDLRRSTLTDRIDFLLVAFQSELTAVADRMLEQLDPEDGTVALMMDIAPAAGTIDQRLADQALFVRHRDATVEAVLRHPGRIFPFVGVHPGRKSSPSTSSLQSSVELAVEAIEDFGFVGVKIYPALGYSPADPRLEPIYRYCVEHQVPVMTHTSGGGFYASEDTRAFSDPKLFVEVLDRFPDLKICFAHFGGSSGVKSLQLIRSRRTNAFGDTILSLMEDHPGVYTDLAFHEDPMKSDESQTAYFDRLKTLLAPGSVHRDRVLFGTDSWLIRVRATEGQCWRFYEEGLGADDFATIAESNPRRYLGLPAEGVSASEPIDGYIDFLLDRLPTLRTGNARPPAWLIGEARTRNPAAASVLANLREQSDPSPRLLVRSFESVLGQLADRTLDAPPQRLTPEAGWKIGGAKMRLGGLDLAIRATAKASLGIEMLRTPSATDADGVLGPVLGAFDSGVLPAASDTSWLKYRLEGLLGLGGTGIFDPIELGLGFDAKRRVVLCDYRAHASSGPGGTTAAIATDLRRPRFALSRSDVLDLGLDDALSLRVTGTLGAQASLPWSTVLSGNLNALGRALGIPAPLDIQIGLGATLTGSVDITDDFQVVFARTRRNPAGRPFKVTVHKADSRSGNVGIELSAGARFADPEVIEAVLSAALGEQLAQVDRLLAKAAAELTPTDDELRNRLVERLGLPQRAMSAIRQRRNELGQQAVEAIEAIARMEVAAGFRFEYSRVDESQVLMEADLSATALCELHGDLARGRLGALLERSENESDDIELLEFLHETTHTRSKSWGFSFGFLSRMSRARDFDFEQTREQRSGDKRKISYVRRGGYEVETRRGATFSGWKWSGELVASMPDFVANPTTRNFRFAVELRLEWTKKMGKRLIGEIADAAVLWNAVAAPETARAALEDFTGRQPTVALRLRIRHNALFEVLRTGAELDSDLAALALAAAMPYRSKGDDPVRSSVAQRRRLYAGLWKRHLADRRRGRPVNLRKYRQMAAEHFRRMAQGDKKIIKAGKFDAKESNQAFQWTFAGAVAKHPNLFRDLSALHKALESSWDAVRPEGTERLVGENVDRLHTISSALDRYWGQCFQIRAFGRYAIETAASTVGGAELVETTLSITHGTSTRLVGAQPTARPRESVEEARPA